MIPSMKILIHINQDIDFGFESMTQERGIKDQTHPEIKEKVRIRKNRILDTKSRMLKIVVSSYKTY